MYHLRSRLASCGVFFCLHMVWFLWLTRNPLWSVGVGPFQLKDGTSRPLSIGLCLCINVFMHMRATPAMWAQLKTVPVVKIFTLLHSNLSICWTRRTMLWIRICSFFFIVTVPECKYWHQRNSDFQVGHMLCWKNEVNSQSPLTDQSLHMSSYLLFRLASKFGVLEFNKLVTDSLEDLASMVFDSESINQGFNFCRGGVDMRC